MKVPHHRLCSATMRWDGAPTGRVYCEGKPKHPGKHYFSWTDPETREWRAIRWSDKDAKRQERQ